MNEYFGTAEFCYTIRLSQAFSGNESYVVAELLPNWHQVIFNIKEIYQFSFVN